MKSFNRVIRASNLENLQAWTPVDLLPMADSEFDVVQSKDNEFFGNVQKMVVEQGSIETQKVLKTSMLTINTKPWTPSNFKEPTQEESLDNIKPWIPFLERETPENKIKTLMEDANKKSQEIISQAMVEADQIRKEAHDQGIENAKAETRETLEAVNTLISVARDWRTDMMNQSEQMVLDLIRKIGTKIFGNGLILDNMTLQQHFAEVLESARALGDLRIYMNPLDAAELGPDWRDLQTTVIGNKVDIISNDSIKRGGCYIQGEWGTADALVETQLEAILKQFSEVEKPESEEE